MVTGESSLFTQNPTLLKNQLESFFSSWSKIRLDATKDSMPEDLIKFFGQWEQLPKDVEKEIELEEQSFEIKIDEFKHFLCNLLPSAMSALNEWRQFGNAINVWEVAGLKRDEVRNSNVLKWLLDRQGSHGQGEAILLKLLKSISASLVLCNFPKLEDRLCHYSSRVESCPLGNREDRVDIEIDAQDFLLFIEVKINAFETKDQLDRYLLSAKTKAGKRPWCILYLTKNGRLPITEENLNAPRKLLASHLVPLSWKDIAKILKQHIKELDEKNFSYNSIQQFISHIQKF